MWQCRVAQKMNTVPAAIEASIAVVLRSFLFSLFIAPQSNRDEKITTSTVLRTTQGKCSSIALR